MKNLRLLIVILSFTSFYSCEKYEGDINGKRTYEKLLAGLELSCPEPGSESFMKAVIENTQVCYFDNVEDRNFTHGHFTSFTTAGPNTTLGVVDSKVKHRTKLSFRHINYIEGEDYIELWLPFTESEEDRITYLKHFFDKKEHKIKGLSNKNEDILIQLSMHDKVTETSGRVYNISSEYGEQRSSYLKVKDVTIKENEKTIQFNFELEFECNLYHFEQLGKEGLWSELTEGVLKAEIKLEK